MTQVEKNKSAVKANESKEKTSLYLSKKDIKSLKYMAFMSQTTQTSILQEAIENHILKWEKDNGPIPKKFLQ